MSEAPSADKLAKPRQVDHGLFSRDEVPRPRFLRWLLEHGRVGDWGPPRPR